MKRRKISDANPEASKSTGLSNVKDKHYALNFFPENTKFLDKPETLLAINETLKKHNYWCSNANSEAYKYYGLEGRRVSPELIINHNVKHNNEACELVYSVIGQKPLGYCLDVDWTSHDGVLTLQNICWVSPAENSQMRENYSKRCSETGRYLSFESGRVGLSSKTAARRFRILDNFDDAINPQHRPDLDLVEQNSKFQEIYQLIKEGKLFADRSGRIFSIFSDGSFYEHQGQIDTDTGYRTMVIKHLNKRVGFRHIVLIQYAGVPPLIEKNGVYIVWTAEHIDCNKLNDSVLNLLWMPYGQNSSFKETRKKAIDYKQKIEELSENGIVIKPSDSQSPYGDNYIQQLEEKNFNARSSVNWSDNMKISWIEGYSDNYEKYASMVENHKLPLDFLIRLALAPRNNPKIIDGEIFVNCAKTGREVSLNDIGPTSELSLYFTYKSTEIIEKLKDVCEVDDFNRIITYIPAFSGIELLEPIGLRSQFYPIIDGVRATKMDVSYYKSAKKSPFNTSFLISHPHLVYKLISDANGKKINPMHLMHGSNKQRAITACAGCEHLLPARTMKEITRSKRGKIITDGNFCQACQACNRAENGRT